MDTDRNILNEWIKKQIGLDISKLNEDQIYDLWIGMDCYRERGSFWYTMEEEVTNK